MKWRFPHCLVPTTVATFFIIERIGGLGTLYSQFGTIVTLRAAAVGGGIEADLTFYLAHLPTKQKAKGIRWRMEQSAAKSGWWTSVV